MSWGAVYLDIHRRRPGFPREDSISSDDESWEEWEESDEESEEQDGSVVMPPPWRRGSPRRWMGGMMPPPERPPPPSSDDDSDSDYVEPPPRWNPAAANWSDRDSPVWRGPPWTRGPPSPQWWCNSPSGYERDTTTDDDGGSSEDDRSPSPPRQRRRIYSPSSPQVHVTEFSPGLWRAAADVARGTFNPPRPSSYRPEQRDVPDRAEDRRWRPQSREEPPGRRSPSVRDSSPGSVMRGREQWGYESGGSISDDSSDFYDGYSDASSVYFERRWRPPTIHIEFSRGPSPARRPSLSPPPPRYRQQVAAAEWPPMLPEIAEERLKRLCEERGLDPDTFMCPITRAPMRSPAVACDGHTYERGAIERWLAGNDKSPITGSRMMTRLVPNVSLRTLMYSLFCGNN